MYQSIEEARLETGTAAKTLRAVTWFVSLGITMHLFTRVGSRVDPRGPMDSSVDDEVRSIE